MIRHLIFLSLIFLLVAAGSAKYQYQCIIDSGSTGSRIYIYRYQVEAPLQTIEEVCSKRVNPSISSFAYDLQGLREYLQSLISFAEMKIEPSFHSSTSICLKGTAGLRTMPDKERMWIMNEVQGILKNTSFAFNPAETRVLTGGEEALFGLLATNIAFSNLTNKLELSLGAGDLGGSSQQMAFVVQPKTFVRSFFDTYFGGILYGGTVATTEKSNGSIVSNSGDDASQDITDECLPNFAVTFPVPATGSVVDQFLSPLTSLVSTYSPAALFAASYNWFASSPTSNENSKIIAESKLSSTLSSHPALDSAFHSSLSGSSVTINIYAKSMAGMGLVAAMNETFYHIAEMHQKRIYNEKLLSQRKNALRVNNGTQTFQCRREIDQGSSSNSDLDDELETSEIVKDELGNGLRTCDADNELFSSFINPLVEEELPPDHSVTIETQENNDGDHLYGEHSSWLHALHQNDEVLENPCAPPGVNLPYPDALSTLRWQGTGNFSACTSYVKHLVQLHALRDRNCLRQWSLQLPVSFIMMDNFPKIFEVMQLPIDELSLSMSPAIVRLRGEDICQQPWTKLQDVYPDFPAYRVQQVCFAASFVYVLMTEVYGMRDVRDTVALNVTLPVPTWHTLNAPETDSSDISVETSDTIPSEEEEEVQGDVSSVSGTQHVEHDDTDVSTTSASFQGIVPASSTGIRFVAMDAHDSFTIGWSLGAAIVSAMNITYTEDLIATDASFLTFDATPAMTEVEDMEIHVDMEVSVTDINVRDTDLIERDEMSLLDADLPIGVDPVDKDQEAISP